MCKLLAVLRPDVELSQAFTLWISNPNCIGWLPMSIYALTGGSLPPHETCPLLALCANDMTAMWLWKRPCAILAGQHVYGSYTWQPEPVH